MDTETRAAAVAAARARVKAAQGALRRAGQELAAAGGGFRPAGQCRVRTPADVEKAAELVLACQQTHGEVDVIVLAASQGPELAEGDAT